MKRNGANLTEGKPVKLILQFAIPVFLGNLFQLFYGLIDTKIVGGGDGHAQHLRHHPGVEEQGQIVVGLVDRQFQCLEIGRAHV